MQFRGVASPGLDDSRCSADVRNAAKGVQGGLDDCTSTNTVKGTEPAIGRWRPRGGKMDFCLQRRSEEAIKDIGVDGDITETTYCCLEGFAGREPPGAKRPKRGTALGPPRSTAGRYSAGPSVSL